MRQPPRVSARRAFIAITVLLAVLGSAAFASGSRRQAHNPQTPAEIADVVAVVPGQVLGVAQDQDEIAWLEASASGCRLHVRSLIRGVKRVIRWAPRCLAAERDLALAGGRTAWGGYEEVRCSETTAAVYASESSRARLVQEIPGDCLGYGTSFQGLVTDGGSFFYALLTTHPKPDSSRCGEGGPCRWRLAAGGIVRIARLRPAPVRALPAAVLIAAAAGRVALVQPAASALARARGPFDWPRAAHSGSVEIRDTKRGRLVTSFRPRGTVRAVSLSPYRAAVLVQVPGGLRIEWYDADTGARLGMAAVASSTARRLSNDGRFVAFAVGQTVRALDLESGRQRLVARATSAPIGLSIRAGRLVWGENGHAGGRIVSAQA